MKTSLRKSVLFAFPALVVFVTACKSRSELRREQEFEKIKAEVTNVKTDRVDFDTQIEELRNELTRQRTLVEETTQANRQLAEEVRKLEALKEENRVLATRVQAIEQRAVDEELQQKKQAEEREKAGFDQGKAFFDQGKYEEAAEIFRSVVKKAKGEESKKAHFHLAESYFNLKDWESAAVEYADFKKQHPKDNLVPTAIYRLALSFKNMGKPKEAKLFYDELIERYPKSPLTAKAKKESAKIK